MPRLEARGVELSWEAVGEGPSVALVHETATTSASLAELAGEIAEAGGRALLYDRRGWGDSSVPEGYRRTTVEEQSEDLAELIATAGAPAAVCGAGLGGLIALDLMLRRPELVSGAVLVEPHLLGLVPAATEMLSEDQLRLERTVAEDRAAAVIDLYLSGGLAALGPGAERLPVELSDASRASPATLIAELGAASAWAMPLGRLAEAERPSAIVVSPATPAVLREAAGALAERLGRSRIVELKVAAGSPHLAEPGLIARLAMEISES